MATIVYNLTLGSMAKKSKVEFALDDPIALIDYLEKEQLSAAEVGMVIQNGRWVAKSKCIINNDDHIELFPHLQGG